MFEKLANFFFFPVSYNLKMPSCLNFLGIFCTMSSESQVKSLLDVVTFILEKLTASEGFDANILSDYFRKHHDIVDVHQKPSFQTETIVIPETAALQDDINNDEELEAFASHKVLAKPTNIENDGIICRLGDVDIMKMPNMLKDPTLNFPTQDEFTNNSNSCT